MQFYLPLAIGFGACAFFAGCDSLAMQGQKEEAIYATVGNAKVYESDVDLFLLERGVNRNSQKFDGQIVNLLRDVAFAEQGAKEFPGVVAAADAYVQKMRSRLLTSVYQRFYAIDKMSYTDEALLAHYKANEARFKSEDSTATYLSVRSKVAEDLYIQEHAADLASYLEQAKNMLGPEAKQDDVEKNARRRFIGDVKQNIMRSRGDELVTKHHFEIAPPVTQDPRKIFDRDSTLWKTAQGLYAYDIEMSDSVALAKVAESIKNLDDFKQAAAKYSRNALLAKRGGELGVVLEDHALPYGIGMESGIFAAYPGETVGLSKIVRVPNPSAFHLYFVTEHIPAKQKSFDRAKGAIEAAIAAGAIPADSLDPVVLKNGSPVLLERDVVELRNELSDFERARYSRTQLATYMMTWLAFADEALELGLDSSWEYRALVRATLRTQVKQFVTDSLKTGRKLSVEEAKPYFEKYGRGFDGKSVEELLPVLSELASIPENEIRFEYFYNKLPSDSSEDYIAALSTTYPGLKTRSDEFKVRRFVSKAENLNPLSFKTENAPSVSWNISTDVAIARADSLASAHKRDMVRWEWSVIRALNPGNDTLYARATYELGKLEVDASNYDEAIKEYSALAYMFPASEYAEKALFNLGFVLDENLERKAEAAAMYRRFMAKYPQSELTESVSWLLKNIESEGKLADELVKKIEKAENQ